MYYNLDYYNPDYNKYNTSSSPTNSPQAVEDSSDGRAMIIKLYNNTVSGRVTRILMSGNYTVKTLGIKKIDEVFT